MGLALRISYIVFVLQILSMMMASFAYQVQPEARVFVQLTRLVLLFNRRQLDWCGAGLFGPPATPAPSELAVTARHPLLLRVLAVGSPSGVLALESAPAGDEPISCARRNVRRLVELMDSVAIGPRSGAPAGEWRVAIGVRQQ